MNTRKILRSRAVMRANTIQILCLSVANFLPLLESCCAMLRRTPGAEVKFGVERLAITLETASDASGGRAHLRDRRRSRPPGPAGRGVVAGRRQFGEGADRQRDRGLCRRL